MAKASGRSKRAVRTKGSAAVGRAGQARRLKGSGAPAGGLRTIYLLSDSTGNLAQHMLTAFLTQFPAKAFRVRPYNFLKHPEKLRAALDELAREPGMVMHAVVSPEMKAAIGGACAAVGLPACDLTGEYVQFIAAHSGVAPNADVARLHDISDEYHRRIKALEFTLEHDDGLGLETLADADIVLAGVSRTSKTPTSIYLAQQGYRVANVSLAKAVQPPPTLLALKKASVVGLLIDPYRLAEIRTNRQHEWQMSDTSYNQLEFVQDEVAWSKRLFARQRWPTLDVTRRAVEETAAKIVELLKLSRPG